MSGLGRGLDALITTKGSLTSKVLPEADHGFAEISVSKISPNPHQPRKHFSREELTELVVSIKEHGLVQPLIVTKKADGYELVAGERRLRAAKEAGLKTVPAVVRTASDQQKLEIALIENIQRQALNALEEATAYKALIDEFHLTQAQVAERVGKSRPEVTNTMRLLDLEKPYQDALAEGKISRTHARTLLAERDPGKRQALFEAMQGGAMTVRQAEARAYVSSHTRAVKKNPNILAHEQKLRAHYGTRVDILEKSGKGNIQFHFFSTEELADLLDQLTD